MKFQKSSAWTREDVARMRNSRAIKALSAVIYGNPLWQDMPVPTEKQISDARALLPPGDRRAVRTVSKWLLSARAHVTT